MTRNSDPWFRFYVRTLNNPKAQRLSSGDFKGWVNLLCLAKEYDGNIPPVEDVSFRLRLSKRKVEALLKSLRSNGLVDGDRMHDWDEMQYPSDSSTERVKRHRERKEHHMDVSSNVSSNVSETVQTRVEKIRTEAEAEAEAEAETEAEAEAEAEKRVTVAKANGRPQASTAETWDAFSTAYLTRYGVEPTRNKRVNSQLKQFTERVPLEEAPAIAAFYLGHNNAFYIRGSHSVGAMLADAEKLRTEWQTGRKVTGRKAMQDEQTATNFDNAERAIEMLERKDHEKRAAEEHRKRLGNNG